MAQMHIGYDGTPRICEAQPGNCKLGEHYDNIKEAYQALEQQNKHIAVPLPTKKKTVHKLPQKSMSTQQRSLESAIQESSRLPKTRNPENIVPQRYSHSKHVSSDEILNKNNEVKIESFAINHPQYSRATIITTTADQEYVNYGRTIHSAQKNNRQTQQKRLRDVAKFQQLEQEINRNRQTLSEIDRSSNFMSIVKYGATKNRAKRMIGAQTRYKENQHRELEKYMHDTTYRRRELLSQEVIFHNGEFNEHDNRITSIGTGKPHSGNSLARIKLGKDKTNGGSKNNNQNAILRTLQQLS